MTEEKDIHTKRYFCIKKREVYRALMSIATSFIGALLALAVFSAVHKPPRIPGQFPPPPPIERVDINIHKGAPGMFHPHADFRGNRPGEMRHHKHHRDAMRPAKHFEQGERPVTPPAQPKPDKK